MENLLIEYVVGWNFRKKVPYKPLGVRKKSEKDNRVDSFIWHLRVGTYVALGQLDLCNWSSRNLQVRILISMMHTWEICHKLREGNRKLEFQ